MESTATPAAPAHLYDPPGWDEALAPDGEPRAEAAGLLEALAGADLNAIAASVRERLGARGVTFSSDNANAEFVVDPIPRIVRAEEWALLERGLGQRAAALNAFIRDAYGARAIAAAGVVPERVLDSADHHVPQLAGTDPGEIPAAVIGFDVVRCGDGRLRVLEDNVRTPSGFLYAGAARAAIDAELPLDPPARLDPADVIARLGDAFRDSSERRAALITDGPGNSAWWEHRELARALGIPLVGPHELRVRRGSLLATIDGDEVELGVVYRRTDQDSLVDDGGRPTWLAAALLEPVRSGRLRVVNAAGAGVADDKLTHAYVEDMIRFYLAEDPVLHSVRTFDLAREADLAEVRDRLEEMVVKPRAGLGGQGVVIYCLADRAGRERVERELRERPEDVIAQEAVRLSTAPTICDGRLEPRHVDLRCYAVGGELAPAPLTRVAIRRGEMIVNSSRDGGAKDTWVLR